MYKKMYVHSNNFKTTIQCNCNYSVIIEKSHKYKVSTTMSKKKTASMVKMSVKFIF